MTSTFPRWKGDNEPLFIFELCRRLTSNFEVFVLAPHTHGASVHEIIEGINIRRFRYFPEKWETLAYEGGILPKLKRHPGYYLLVPFFLASQLYVLHRVLKQENINLVHAHWLIPQGLTTLAYKFLAGSRFPAWLCTSHGSDLFKLDGRFLSILKRRILKSADAITVVSHAMKEQAVLLGAAPEKLFVMPMGIDTVQFQRKAASPEKSTGELLFVGRLVPSKAVDSLIRAMPIILDRHPETILTIVGDGPERKKLEMLALSLKISSQVSFLGALPNFTLPPLYRRATVFITPSLSEGFGLTITEAMACGCAVIASDLPAVRETIVDGKTGLLIPPGDSREIARKTLELLDTPALRESFERAGRNLVSQRFDWDMVAHNYATLLRDLNSRALCR